jgi:outer membrane receptor protein involved in Fe transport
VFARYSKGARASAERILFTPAVNYANGQLNDPAIAVSPVKQAEAGLKLRKGGVTVFVTGFWASTKEKSLQIANDATGRPRAITVDRTYSAKGIELESDFRRGPFSLALGATYAKAKIDSDSTDATLVGNRPRHQPSVFFNARPQFEKGIVTIGTNINGTTSSFSQDSNILKQPGYVVVSPFLFVRPLPRVEFGVNAFNVFNQLALVSVAAAAIPAGGIVNAQAMTGRTVTGTLRYSF